LFSDPIAPFSVMARLINHHPWFNILLGSFLCLQKPSFRKKGVLSLSTRYIIIKIDYSTNQGFIY
jgi:hypothetical protein